MTVASKPEKIIETEIQSDEVLQQAIEATEQKCELRRELTLSAKALRLTIIGQIATGEAIKRLLCDCRTLEAQLLSDGACSLERLLVERIVLCWLRLQYAEGC